MSGPEDVLRSHGIHGFTGSEVACRCSPRQWRYLLDWHTHVAAAIREWLLSDEVVERAARAHYGGTLGVTLGMESDEFRADRLNDMRAALRAATEADA